MEYGSENKVNALATLLGIFMPALLPPCSTLFEDGPSFLGSNEVPHFMEVSPDGFIMVCSLESCYQPCKVVYNHKSTLYQIIIKYHTIMDYSYWLK